jgi:hypothetical protein
VVAVIPAGYVAGVPGLVVGPRTELMRSRNFYGALAVLEWEFAPGHSIRGFFHGRIVHGLQFVNVADRLRPLSYYSDGSGIGRLLPVMRDRRGAAAAPLLRIGVVGLGAGTIGALAAEGDAVRFYEIDPDVERVARTYFTFLTASPAAPAVDVVLGDGRLALEREPAETVFDVLVLDAFSGDAVPVHLLTAESFDVYRRHLAPDGVIAINISNHHLDLRPIVARAAEQLEMHGIVAEHDPPSGAGGVMTSRWALLSSDAALLESEPFRTQVAPLEVRADVQMWTDDNASLFQVLK